MQLDVKTRQGKFWHRRSSWHVRNALHLFLLEDEPRTFCWRTRWCSPQLCTCWLDWQSNLTSPLKVRWSFSIHLRWQACLEVVRQVIWQVYIIQERREGMKGECPIAELALFGCHCILSSTSDPVFHPLQFTYYLQSKISNIPSASWAPISA